MAFKWFYTYGFHNMKAVLCIIDVASSHCRPPAIDPSPLPRTVSSVAQIPAALFRFLFLPTFNMGNSSIISVHHMGVGSCSSPQNIDVYNYEPNLIANSFGKNQFPAMSDKLEDMHGKDVSRKTTPSSQPTTKNTNPPPASHVSPLEIVLVLHIQKPTLHGTLRVLPSEIKQQRSEESTNIIWQKSGSRSRVKVRPGELGWDFKYNMTKDLMVSQSFVIRSHVTFR